MKQRKTLSRRSIPLLIALLVLFATAMIALADWTTIDTDDDDIDPNWGTPVYTDATNDSGVEDQDEIRYAWYAYDGDNIYFRMESWASGNILSSSGYKRAIGALDCNRDGDFEDAEDRAIVVKSDSNPDNVFIYDGTMTQLGGTDDDAHVDKDGNNLEWRIDLNLIPPECRGSDQPTPLTLSIINATSETTYDVISHTDLYTYSNPIDYGDAKNVYDWDNDVCQNYNTIVRCNGPRHGLTNLKLGADIDSDGGDLQDDAAVADDNDNIDDEDGVAPSPGVIWTAGGTGSLDVTVSGGSGYLSCWIDWDGDETFETSERVVNDQSLTAGDHTISVNVPSGTAFSGPYMARCRLAPNSGEGNKPIGAVWGGEVEDYDWLIQPVDLNIAISGSDVSLTWTHLSQNDSEQAYESATPYFDYASATPLGTSGTSGSATDSGEVGAPANSVYYKVVGQKSVSGTTLYSTPSKEVGLFEFDLVPGTS